MLKAEDGRLPCHKPQRPVRALADAYARRHFDVEGTLLYRPAHHQAAAGDIGAIVGARDGHRQGELAGTRGQVLQALGRRAVAHV